MPAESHTQRGDVASSRVGSTRVRRTWLPVVLACLVLLSGLAASYLVGAALAAGASGRAAQAFKASSQQITATLRLEIEREQDLVAAETAEIVGSPNLTDHGFESWTASVGAFERYPELVGLGLEVMVPAGSLDTFAHRIAADPPAPLGPDDTITVIPPGPRPFYCLQDFSVSRSRSDSYPEGYDLCWGSLGRLALAARDSGESSYIPYSFDGQTLVAVASPLYRGGTAPSAVAARRASFVGWMGTLINAGVVTTTALQGHPGMGLTLKYDNDGTDAVFKVGRQGSGLAVLATSLHNGWMVDTYAAKPSSAIESNQSALVVLLVGVIATLSLAILILTLSAGRVRALRLVDAKTGELRHQALHDTLTGLPNRALVADRAKQLMARNQRVDSIPAAMYLDLDGFKNVNDTLGHDVGDRLLHAVAARMESCLRDADTIGRLGGDEFVVLLDEVGSTEGAEQVAQRIVDVMSQPFDLPDVVSPVVASVSIGIAVGIRDSAQDLLRDADLALYEAKAAGKNCYRCFDADMNAGLQRRRQIEFELRGALDEDQFHLVYQPIFDLDDLSLVGVEALLRWNHPTLGVIGPDEFIPLLEASGQIVTVGQHVLDAACTQVAYWQTHRPEMTVAVNVSGRQLDHDDIIEHVRRALDTSGLDPASLTIEITETTLMRNVDETAARLHQLKALGVQIAIDDFGTGYSSLAYIQRFPIDCLKIDRTFTQGISTSPEADLLVHTLVRLGKELGLRTVAEGIETMGQVTHLRSEHVDEAQGFLLAKPLDAQTIETQLLEATAHNMAARPRSII